MRGERHGCVTAVEGEELGAEFREVDFLGVGAAVGVCGRIILIIDLLGDLEDGLPSFRTMVRVRFCIDSSITSERTSIMAFDWSSEKPSALRRWTNFRVSKWWSR